MTPAQSGTATGTTTLRLVPRDPDWLHDFRMTHDLLLAPYHAAWSARRSGIGDQVAPAWPAGLENITDLDAPTALDAWSNIHRAFPSALVSSGALNAAHDDPTRGSMLHAPDGRRLIPLHPVTLDESDLRALTRVRRAVRVGAKVNPSLRVPHRADGAADIASVPTPGAYLGTVERTVAVLTLAPDEDVDILAGALAPERFGQGARRVDLSDVEYAAYERFADRLAAAAMTGEFAGDRALFRSRY
ncbi:hypothetical protein [Streptomyces sp. 1222.5]|uniref:hypothetical protein n=1 Tax=Streptomyces sp. 1222.5 TaxID=1881026 RepID=UPI003EBACF75